MNYDTKTEQNPDELPPNASGYGRNGQELAHLRQVHGQLRNELMAFKQAISQQLEAIHRRINLLTDPTQTHVNQLLNEAQEKVDEARNMVSGEQTPNRTVPRYKEQSDAK